MVCQNKEKSNGQEDFFRQQHHIKRGIKRMIGIVQSIKILKCLEKKTKEKDILRIHTHTHLLPTHVNVVIHVHHPKLNLFQNDKEYVGICYVYKILYLYQTY